MAIDFKDLERSDLVIDEKGGISSFNNLYRKNKGCRSFNRKTFYKTRYYIGEER